MIKSFIDWLTTDKYPDVITEFTLPMVIAVFAFAFPLLLQVASRIDDKYESTLLIKVFRKDPLIEYFLCGLLFALICVFIYILDIFDGFYLLLTLISISLIVALCLADNRKLFAVFYGFAVVCDICLLLLSIIPELSVVAKHLTILLSLISTFVLVLLIFCVIWLMYVYYMPDKLLDRLKKQYYKRSAKDKPVLFMAISKLMHYAIKKSDSELSISTLQFYEDEFENFKKNKKNEICEYPEEYYRVINETNEIVYMEPKKETSFFNESVMLGLLIDEVHGSILGERTYSEIWKGMRQALYYNRTDFIIAYWRKAHQYMTFRLGTISPKYDNNDKVTNQSVIDGRNAEREKFLEFHYALGGLLMMKQKYALIKSIISWTNQMPPKYILIPETMGKVIMKFMEVERRKGADFLYYAQRYPFPDISGVYANDFIKMWIKRYIAILFLLQYTLPDPYYCSRLKMPNPPQTLSEMRSWIDELDILKIIVEEYLSDKACLKSLNLEVLSSPEWFETNKKESPEKWIESLKKQCEKSIEQKKVNQELDPDKINQLNTETKKILTKCFDYYEQLFTNVIKDTEPHESLFYGGKHEIFEKIAFAKDQDISDDEFVRIYAENIANEFKCHMPSIFRVHYKTTSYVLDAKDIFPTIDKLQLDNQQFTIVSVGLNLDLYKSIGVTSKEKGFWVYKGISIIELEKAENDTVNYSLFVMQNEDLPCILHKEANSNDIKNYDLKSIDDKYHIYTNVIDLHKNEDIRNEVREKTKNQNLDKSLDKSVVVCVSVNTEVRCKKNAKCIQLQVSLDNDNPNNPDDVKNVWV